MPQGIAVRFRLWSVFLSHQFNNQYKAIRKIKCLIMHHKKQNYLETLKIIELLLNCTQPSNFYCLLYKIKFFSIYQLCLFMPKNHLFGYLTIGVGLGALYLLLNKLIQKKQISSNMKKREVLTIEVTRSITQQIKYQMLTICMTFANQLRQTLKKKMTADQLQRINSRLKSNMVILYQQKQTIILSKYQFQKQQYAKALHHYQNDAFLASTTSAIMKMMQAAIQGHIPDISVPEQALECLNPQQVLETHKQVSKMVVIQVWKKIIEFIQKDEDFNVKEEEDFTRMIRQVGVYQKKVKFLQERGYKPQWGCPNEIFLKVTYNLKIENNNFKLRIEAIDKTYQLSLQKITDQPEKLDINKIRSYFNQQILRFKIIIAN